MSARSERFDDIGAGLAALLHVPAEMAALREEIVGLRAEVIALREALPPMLVNVQQAAERLGVSVPTVRRLVRAGRLPSVHIGSSVRVDLSRVRPIDPGEVAQLAAQARRGVTPLR